MDELKQGQMVSIKIGNHIEKGKVVGVMGDYATVSIKSLGKQITTTIKDLIPVDEETRGRKPKIVEYSGHRGDELEEFRKSLNISKKKFYVDICKIPSGSYVKMVSMDNITKPMWEKLVKGKEFIESLDENEIEVYRFKEPKSIRLNWSNEVNEKEKKDEIIEQQNQLESENYEMDTKQTWLQRYKEFMKSLSMKETLDFFDQVNEDKEGLEKAFNELKESII
ncbi:hypothetical protein [Floccifex sp.]|uniref:hypothetical protein n=1 Tax=Floccifex sp. TaxID=2815810 RepID=UPI003EFE8DAC